MSTARNRNGSATITLPSDREILITRRFDAPARLVFEAWTTPELVKRWWGFDTSQWLVCEIDLREGGRWRYVTREADGTEVGFHGEYRAIDPPRRLVSTEVFAAGSLNTILFDERARVTTLTINVVHQRREHRDAHVASGMEGGMQISMNRLEDVVAELDRGV
jgi:uncharacterized protein YndB with AHSA1/START domain